MNLIKFKKYKYLFEISHLNVKNHRLKDFYTILENIFKMETLYLQKIKIEIEKNSKVKNIKKKIQKNFI